MHSTHGTKLSAWSKNKGRNKPESNNIEARGTKQNDREGELQDEEFPWSSLYTTYSLIPEWERDVREEANLAASTAKKEDKESLRNNSHQRVPE